MDEWRVRAAWVGKTVVSAFLLYVVLGMLLEPPSSGPVAAGLRVPMPFWPR